MTYSPSSAAATHSLHARKGHASIRTTADIYGSPPDRFDRSVATKLDKLFREAGESRGADVAQAAGGTSDMKEPGHNPACPTTL